MSGNPIVDDIKAGLAALVQTLVGTVLMAGGVVALWWEKTHAPTHDTHLVAALVVALLGASIIPSVGPVLIKSLKALVGVLTSVLPARPKDGA